MRTVSSGAPMHVVQTPEDAECHHNIVFRNGRNSISVRVRSLTIQKKVEILISYETVRDKIEALT